ncbi:phenylacetic acid degradation protein PaaN, partial [bacterium]|nr:phenylacetic acid degradation protein PaaN [bacterium]
MTHPLFDKHHAKLESALNAIHTRGYWAAADDGKKAFEAHLGQKFELQQPGTTAWLGGENSPFGIDLNVSYPVSDIQALIDAGQAAMTGWQAAGVEGRTGLCIEMLDRLNAQS